jgi:hypothetical protein
VAVLVTVFGSAAKHAASHPVAGAGRLAQANEAFVYAADRAFVAATLFLLAALALVALAVRTPLVIAEPEIAQPEITQPEPALAD